jgi:DNA-binding XRE family transcriptional regulator
MKYRRDSKKFLRIIGDKFQSLRIVQKKELESVAKAVKISSALLVRIERGDYDMYLDLLVELCDHYEMAPHDFFRDVDNDLKTL